MEEARDWERLFRIPFNPKGRLAAICASTTCGTKARAACSRTASTSATRCPLHVDQDLVRRIRPGRSACEDRGRRLPPPRHRSTPIRARSSDALPGSPLVDLAPDGGRTQDVVPGQEMGTFAYARTISHRNLFRLHLP